MSKTAKNPRIAAVAQAFVVIGPNAWGKGPTLAQAKIVCAQNMPRSARRSFAHRVYVLSCSPEQVECSDAGVGVELNWPPDTTVIKFDVNP